MATRIRELKQQIAFANNSCNIAAVHSTITNYDAACERRSKLFRELKEERRIEADNLWGKPAVNSLWAKVRSKGGSVDFFPDSGRIVVYLSGCRNAYYGNGAVRAALEWWRQQRA